MPIEVNDKGELIDPPFQYNNLRSEAMSELISRKPSFWNRWALLILAFILVLLTSATWFMHYPDVIKTRATLVATNAPKEIFALQEGRLMRLFVRNNDTVEKADVLGFIESNASHDQVLLLEKKIDTTLLNLQQDNAESIVSRFDFNFFDALGELQPGYQQFINAYQQFSDYLKDGFYLKKKLVLAEDLTYLLKNYDIIQQQKTIMLKDLNLSEETYMANEKLLKDKVISRQDDRNEQSKLLGKQMTIPQINISLLANESMQREKQKEMNELEHSISQQKIVFRQAAQTFQSQVNEWVRKYVIKSPIAGRVSFPGPLQENQFVKNTKVLMFVNPGNTQYYAEINLPQYNFGKAEIGQKVQLRFDAYPYQEFGYVNGELTYITDFASDSGFLAHVQLPSGLNTSQHKTLHFREGLQAESQIITKDMRLLERFYYNIVSTLKR